MLPRSYFESRGERLKSSNDNWATFKQTFETLLQDAFQLKRDKAIDPSETYASSRNELERRLDRLLDFQSENVQYYGVALFHLNGLP